MARTIDADPAKLAEVRALLANRVKVNDIALAVGVPVPVLRDWIAVIKEEKAAGKVKRAPQAPALPPPPPIAAPRQGPPTPRLPLGWFEDEQLRYEANKRALEADKRAAAEILAAQERAAASERAWEAANPDPSSRRVMQRVDYLLGRQAPRTSRSFTPAVQREIDEIVARKPSSRREVPVQIETRVERITQNSPASKPAPSSAIESWNPQWGYPLVGVVPGMAENPMILRQGRPPKVTKAMLESAMRATGGNKRQAAKLLRMSRVGLYKALERVGLPTRWGESPAACDNLRRLVR